MSTPKTQKKMSEKNEKSRGTLIAEKARSRANKYTDGERAALLNRTMALIYGGGKHGKRAVNSN